MKLLEKLFGRGRERAHAKPAASGQSARDRAAAREYWEAQVAADLKRRGVSSNRRTP
jgi:hypothetical protein